MTSDVSADFNSFSNVDNQTTTNSLRLETTDFSKYLRNIAGIHVSYLPVAVICTGLDLIFTLITLVMGSTNMSECPIEPLIPIYLVVISTINLVMVSLTTIAIILHMRKIDEDIFAFFYVNSSAVVILLLQLFSFIWLILGSVWTFSVYNDVQYSQTNQNSYCKSSLYKYTIVSIVLQYIIPFVLCGARNASSIRRQIH